jgi:hypothetical protein
MILEKQYTSMPLYLLIQYPRFTAAQKNLKIKEIYGPQFSKHTPSDNRL